MVKVLIAEDSVVIQEFLKNILESDPDIQVIEMVNNGEKAIEAVKRTRPDVVTMDINMPVLNGFDATRIIMEATPTPIVIVSGEWDTKKVETIFLAMEAGAIACVARPPGAGHLDHESSTEELIRTVKSMSEVKVIKRWPRLQKKGVCSLRKDATVSEAAIMPAREIKVVAIGASVGGPIALQTILAAIPSDFHAPIVIVQHISAGFTQGLVEWLSMTSAIPVRLGRHGEKILPGHAYVAPEHCQMRVMKDGVISLREDAPQEGLRPSVSCLFRSIADVYGKNAAGVLLTGMGRDGAQELKLMKDNGAVTIVQNEETSVVFGMPGEAVRIGGAAYVLPLEDIAQMLEGLVNKG
ncbi:MAG: chemotaxis response regulator protein-glutamate methylesterase [Syntrophus sp. (in: bacteria)]|nr:chemotaxis response regulator protein-glutamate methylesterase [Syntrophus sp. (in: bacteria)]